MGSLELELGLLAVHLAGRRADTLRAWRDAIRKDPTLTSGDSLPRAQLNDHIPSVLEAFERELSLGAGEHLDTEERNEGAAAHGLHRWQQGYDLREVIRELGALNVCVVCELDAYAKSHPELEHEVMATARRQWASSCSVDIESSTHQYFRLQQTEAAGHIEDLEKALRDLRELERQRGALWHEAAHDLRGNVGVVSNAAAGLLSGAARGDKTELFMRMLQRNVTSLRHLLDDVTGLARLQAGREERQLTRFDAGAVLVALCEGMLPLAQERGLFLHWEGPAPFNVEGDSVKARRLAQNLVLNALKYTREGGVTVTWGDSQRNDPKRWMFTVKDTGPGFHAGPGAPLAGALEEATQLAQETDGPAPIAELAAPVPSMKDPRAVQQAGGEGIGLSIVKRLAELLKATVELDSSEAQGTTFRILLPRSYAAD